MSNILFIGNGAGTETLKKWVISGFLAENGGGFDSLDKEYIEQVLDGANTVHVFTASASGADKLKVAAAQIVDAGADVLVLPATENILLVMECSPDMALEAVTDILEYLEEHASPDAKIRFFTAIDKTLSDTVTVTAITAAQYDTAITATQ